LKWAGGKSLLFPQIMALVPPDERKGAFIEPFVGSGVVALNAPFERIVINDTNEGLMLLWTELKWGQEDFIEECRELFTGEFNNQVSFQTIRASFNKQPCGKYFLYLNRHCFNGLCRFNLKGEFNVPFGKYDKPYFPEKELREALLVLKKTRMYQLDFGDMMNMAEEGDVVYCDPPYLPLSDTSNFTAYSKGGFSMDDQVRLVDRALRLRDRGATVIISNNDTPLARNLYKKADHIHFLQVAKRISCKADGRKKSGELMAVYRP